MTHSRKRPLRQAFVTAAATAAAIVAVGCVTTVTSFSGNPEGCPASAPSVVDGCAPVGLTCTYPDACGLDAEYTCEGDSWDVRFSGTCNPPPPFECPATLPEHGGACFADYAECSYIEELCGSELTATCSGGVWTVEDPPPCNPPFIECPIDIPEVGLECSPELGSPASCTYPQDTPCGSEPVEVGCAYDPSAGVETWQLIAGPSCTAAPEQCRSYGGSSVCNGDPGCVWLVPGCAGEGMAPSIETAGCYPATDCASANCDAWGSCELVTHNPCWNAFCDACGSESEVCVPTP